MCQPIALKLHHKHSQAPPLVTLYRIMVRGTNPTSSAVYSIELEAQAQTWIEEVTGEAFQGEFAEELRDGRRLCNLVNAIKPGFVRRVNNSPGMPFKQMENISNFLKACRVVGVPEYSLFETVDLFELKDLGIVVKCLVSEMRASGSLLPFLRNLRFFACCEKLFYCKCWWVYLLFIASASARVLLLLHVLRHCCLRPSHQSPALHVHAHCVELCFRVCAVVSSSALHKYSHSYPTLRALLSIVVL